MQGRLGADYFFNELYRPIHASRVSPRWLNILISRTGAQNRVKKPQTWRCPVNSLNQGGVRRERMRSLRCVWPKQTRSLLGTHPAAPTCGLLRPPSLACLIE
jgi:hypothetical protein